MQWAVVISLHGISSAVSSNGRIFYIAQEKASESADSLDLQLFGRSVTRVGDKHFRTEPQKRKFLSYDLDIGSFAGKANVGTHIFPFSVKLPEDLVPSMEV